MDAQKLIERVKESGLKKTFIADKLGISYQSYLNREAGKYEFTATEIAQLKTILGLSNKDIAEIFLT